MDDEESKPRGQTTYPFLFSDANKLYRSAWVPVCLGASRFEYWMPIPLNTLRGEGTANRKASTWGPTFPGGQKHVLPTTLWGPKLLEVCVPDP